MYFVGIDISKFKHDCAIIDELCDTVCEMDAGVLKRKL